MNNTRIVFLCVAFLVFAMLFTACSKNNEFIIASSSETSDSLSTECPVVPPTIEGPEKPGNSLINFDQNREIFIAWQNTDITYNNYTKMTSSWVITLYSKTPLDTKDIKFELNTEYPYDILLWEVDPERIWQTELTSQNTQYSFYYYLYQCYAGVDYRVILEANKKYVEAESNYNKNPSSENLQKLSDLEAEYWGLLYADLKEFEALPVDQIPKFYVYGITVNFSKPVEAKEVITEASCTIAGKTYTESVSIVLEPDEPETNYPLALGLYSGMSMGYRPCLYSYGYATDVPFIFTAEQDMTLTDIYILRDLGEILETKVTIKSGEIKTDFFWDGTEPLMICKGEEVQMLIYLHSDLFDSITYAFNLQVALDCVVDGSMVTYVSDKLLTSELGQNYHDVYAVVFKGLDMEDYWNYYFEYREPWRSKYLGN